MMREIEIADLTYQNFHFVDRDRTVALTWTTSKTDPEAKAITRVLQCLCTPEKCDIRCPYDNARQIVKLTKTFAAEGVDHICLDNEGVPASKQQVLNTCDCCLTRE